MTYEETLELYEPGDLVSMYDGRMVTGMVVSVEKDGSGINIQWNDLSDTCLHLSEEYDRIYNTSRDKRWRDKKQQFNRMTYYKWFSKLDLKEKQKIALQMELERLSEIDGKRTDNDFFAGRVAAFTAVWKLLEGTYTETDYCP